MKTVEATTQVKTLSEPTLMPLARLAVETNFKDIPPPVIHQARLSLLDTLGCIIRGYSLEEAAKVIRVEKEIGGKEEATIFCSGDKVPALAAARANGYMGDIVELNDLTYGHGGIGNIPAALAMAEYQKAPGKELLTAIVIGYEVVGRIYNTYYWYKKDWSECCVIPPGAVNHFGAAAAASKMFGFDVEKTFHALNMAGTFAGMCPGESLEKGGSVKPYMFGGWPAYVGIYSAICAKNGLTGTPSILEGKMGLLSTLAYTFDLSPITRQLGEQWVLEKPRRKAHACCGLSHSSIDTTMAIVRENGISIDDIEKIELSVAPYIITLVGGDSPPDAVTSKFSLRYVVAVAITKMSSIVPEDTMEEEFNKNMAGGIPKLMAKIDIKPEPSYPYFSYCTAKITTKSGKEYSKYLEHPKGDPENPLTESELLEKFRLLASPVFKPDRVDQIIKEIYSLEKRDNITGLVKSLIAK